MQTTEMLCAAYTGRKEEASLIAVKEYMLEKGSWTHSSNGDSDAKRKNECPDSDEERMPTPCLKSINMESDDSEFSADVPALGDQTFVAENNLKWHQLNDSRCTESDLAFGNGLEDKGNNDLLFYGWPELENFEDVDNMFRSCDSSFGLDIDNGDHFSWFPSSLTIEGSTDDLTSSFDFPSCSPCGPDTITEQQEVYGQSNNGFEVNESQKELTLASRKRDSLKSIPDNHLIDTKPEMQSHVSPSKHHKSSEGKRRDHSSENGVSFIQFDKLSEAGESNHLSNSRHNFSSEDDQQREINHQPCLQTSMLIIKPNYNNPSNQVLPGLTTIIKPEVNVLPTVSAKESSLESNQKHSVEISHDVSKKKTYSENKKKRKSHEHRSSRPTEKSNLLVQRADSDLLYVKKPIPGGENQAEGQSEVDGTDICFSGELESTTVRENSCTSSILDEVSIDANSLKLLQHVMVQLDRRTRLCIRDSLYRLARSAAQRHNCVNYSSVDGDDKNATGALLSDGTNKSTGFIDIETDTNPIDRSIAHLLFHRPSDPSAAATPAVVDTVAVKSHTVVEPLNPSTADKPVCKEQTILVNEEATKQRN